MFQLRSRPEFMEFPEPFHMAPTTTFHLQTKYTQGISIYLVTTNISHFDIPNLMSTMTENHMRIDVKSNQMCNNKRGSGCCILTFQKQHCQVAGKNSFPLTMNSDL